jgi:hypothetical protein
MIDVTVPLSKGEAGTPDLEAKEKSLEAVLATMSEIRKCLYDLMNDDSFKRFLNSQFYTQLQDDAKQHFLSQHSSDISDEISKYAARQYDTRSASSGAVQDDVNVGSPYRKAGTELPQVTELQMAEIPELTLSRKPATSEDLFRPPSSTLSLSSSKEKSSSNEKSSSSREKSEGDLLVDTEIMTSSREGGH